jgi:hypothetical protein
VNDEKSIWVKLIRAKYPSADDIFGSSSQGGSPFWQNIHGIKDHFRLIAKFSIGKGNRIRIWTDCWIGDAPLCTTSLQLFEICSLTNALDSQVLAGHEGLMFFRKFGPNELE